MEEEDACFYEGSVCSDGGHQGGALIPRETGISRLAAPGASAGRHANDVLSAGAGVRLSFGRPEGDPQVLEAAAAPMDDPSWGDDGYEDSEMLDIAAAMLDRKSVV